MSDLIDRQAAIDQIKKNIWDPAIVHDVEDILRELPSAQPDVSDINVGDMERRREMNLFKLKIRTASGLEFNYKHVARINYASPRHIDFVSLDMIHTRIWSDNVTGLFYDITMEVEDDDQIKENE